jgi:hypothetical protein
MEKNRKEIFENMRINTKVVAILSIAVMLLSMAFGVITVSAASSAQSSVIMGGMPTGSGSGVTSVPAGVTPSITVDTRAFLSFEPNPIGVGQELLVNMWTNPPINPNRHQIGYTVTIEKPDGTTFTVGPFNSYLADATGYFTFVPDVAGTWRLKFDYSGTYFPNGTWNSKGYLNTTADSTAYYIDSAYYRADSTEWQNLTVQDSFVYSWPLTNLPTDYWTRPVHLENRAWWPILGSYPSYGLIGGGNYWPEDTNIYSSNYNYIPYVTAPNSAHVVYKQQQGIAGMIGGAAGQYSTSASGSPSVIYAGRAYQTMTIPIDGVPTSCAVCWNIRTGEQYYAIPVASGGTTPQVVSYTAPAASSFEGAGLDQTYSVSLINLANNRLIKINPATGAVTLNVTGMTPQLLGGSQGSVSQTGFYADPFVISIQTIGSGASTSYRLINWTTAGTTTNFTQRIMNNVSLPWGLVTFKGGLQGYSGIVADFESNIMVWMNGLAPDGLGVYHGTWMQAADMTTGALLWNKTYAETRYSTAAFTADHGLVACVMEEGNYYAYNIRTGDFVWKTPQMDYPWASAGFGAYSVMSAYGILIRNAYDGVYAYNWTNGALLWHFVAPAVPFESAYYSGNQSVYSFNSQGFIADGKLFTYNTEHTPSYPRTRGWKLFAIDMFTGEGIWNITGSISTGAVADGYLVSGNPDDGYVYSFGKGQSATTVTAPDTVVALGQGIVIKGSVLDLSPAQPNTPCVSDASMTTQMEYLHMQIPIGGLWGNATMTGVNVKLSAIDPNGNYIDIGTAVSDAYSGNYAFTWTPQTQGDYKLIASFEGSESYGSSSSNTGLSIGAAAATTQPTTTANIDFAPVNNTLNIVTAAVAIAIVLAVINAVLLLRKK